MTERPILFSGPMVRAILAGQKTQTRRVCTPDWLRCLDPSDATDRACAIAQCPYGYPGDRLWVRETFASFYGSSVPIKPSDASYVVLRDGGQVLRDRSYRPPLASYAPRAFDGIRWRPSIHMPRWASRIDLAVESVRLERLQAITEDDARAEGVEALGARQDFRGAFISLWESINGERAPWESDPWVWVVSFSVAAVSR